MPYRNQRQILENVYFTKYRYTKSEMEEMEADKKYAEEYRKANAQEQAGAAPSLTNETIPLDQTKIRFLPRYDAKPGKRFTTEEELEMLSEPCANYLPFARLAEKIGFRPEETTIRKVLAASNLLQIAKGNGNFHTEIRNRLEGKVPDKIELSTASPFDGMTDDDLRALLDDKQVKKIAKGNK